MKLTIIIPYYNTPKETLELLEILDPQITDEVEVHLINDGSDSKGWLFVFASKYRWLWVTSIKHSGQSKARNLGLDEARGDYIQFIDSDDLVADNFIEKLLEKIPEGNDLIEYSWQSFGDKQTRFMIPEHGRCLNISACTRCFKKSFIGDTRFNEEKDATEDEDFARRLRLHSDPTITVSTIRQTMYYYRKHKGGTEDSFKKGLKQTKKIVYYYREVTSDRADILEAIKEDDRKHQVWLLTYKNEIPELERYCQVLRPFNTWAHKLKGEPFSRVRLITKEAGSERLSEKENEVHPSESGI